MGKYEEGLPPLNPVRLPDKPEKGVEHEGQTVKLVLEFQKAMYEEFIERVLKKEYSIISKQDVQFEIAQSMRVRIVLESLLFPPGTSIIRKLPDGSEQPILPVTGL